MLNEATGRPSATVRGSQRFVMSEARQRASDPGKAWSARRFVSAQIQVKAPQTRQLYAERFPPSDLWRARQPSLLAAGAGNASGSGGPSPLAGQRPRTAPVVKSMRSWVRSSPVPVTMVCGTLQTGQETSTFEFCQDSPEAVVLPLSRVQWHRRFVRPHAC